MLQLAITPVFRGLHCFLMWVYNTGHCSKCLEHFRSWITGVQRSWKLDRRNLCSIQCVCGFILTGTDKLADKFGRKILHVFVGAWWHRAYLNHVHHRQKHVICSYDRRWHCMGGHSCNALCHPFINTSCKANRRIYGHIQRNNYYTPNRGWFNWRSCINSWRNH